ncbi:methyltransferase domain-containing protein [Actinosynnema sp. NPDC002837]
MAESIPAVVEAFDHGSAEFAEWTPLLWDPIGAATVEAAPPRPGGRVLDVCCGSGSSAIPAARAVGVEGLVDAVDLARELLDQGIRRAEGLPQLRFHHADASRWTSVDGLPYDRVQCVFGIFFLPDMDAAAAHLVGLLRPGGAFGVTTWRQGSVDDVVGPLVQALTEQTGRTLDRPASAERAARVDTEEKLAGWLSGLGLGGVDVRSVERDIPLTPDSAWSFVMGSGIRAALDGLDAPVVSAVNTRYRELMATTTTLRARALVGTGSRPS